MIAPALSIVITAPSQTPLPFWIGLMGVCPLALVIPWAFSLSAGMWTSPTRRWRTAALLLSALAVTWSISVTLLMVAREPYCPDYIEAAAEDGMCDGAMTTATATLFTGTAGVVALVAMVVAALAAAWWVRELHRHEGRRPDDEHLSA